MDDKRGSAFFFFHFNIVWKLMAKQDEKCIQKFKMKVAAGFVE